MSPLVGSVITLLMGIFQNFMILIYQLIGKQIINRLIHNNTVGPNTYLNEMLRFKLLYYYQIQIIMDFLK